MKKTDLQEYQEELKLKLNQVFSREVAQTEWSSMINERDLFIYSPRIDVAVGPFATENTYAYEYDEFFNNADIQDFLRDLYKANRVNLGMINDDFVQVPSFEDMIYMNHNARCFMAIEIENFVSHKHIMGGAINASALGRIGVVMPWSQEKLRSFVRFVRYLHYLRYARKNTFDTSNLLIVTKEQMETAIQNRIDNVR